MTVAALDDSSSIIILEESEVKFSKLLPPNEKNNELFAFSFTGNVRDGRTPYALVS